MRPSPRLRSLGGLALGGQSRPAAIDGHQQSPLGAVPAGDLTPRPGGGYKVARLAPVLEEEPGSPRSPLAELSRRNAPRAWIPQNLPVTSAPVRADMIAGLPSKYREKGIVSRILRTVQEQTEPSSSSMDNADKANGPDFDGSSYEISVQGRDALDREVDNPRNYAPRIHPNLMVPEDAAFLEEQATLLGSNKSRPRHILEDMYQQEGKQRAVWWEALSEVKNQDRQDNILRQQISDRQAREEMADCRRIHKAFNHQSDFDKQYSCYSRAARAGMASGADTRTPSSPAGFW